MPITGKVNERHPLNVALRKAGYAERIVQGRGHCYFVGGDAFSWPSQSVPVCWLRDLSPDTICQERNYLAGLTDGLAPPLTY